MSLVVACDPQALVEIAQRLRSVADQVDAHPVAALAAAQGNAFLGAAPGVRSSFDELCSDASRAKAVLARQLRDLARAIDQARDRLIEMDRCLGRSLAGFVA